MAGAGIGVCIICGRDNQPIVNDICQDCTMDEFWASLGTPNPKPKYMPPAYTDEQLKEQSEGLQEVAEIAKRQRESDTLKYGQLVEVQDVNHPMNGRVGKIVPGLNHPAAIKLEPNQYWVEMIGNDGDKFYGRYFRYQLVIK